ncbi:hypothetical protein J0X19_19805 [Hymenobacter sp. BT186]|uniref:STAS/SEC14 domain-containing protein n=1 Tax=Hymenobacter telluris TaxID=2816474 RepID=A0A939F0T1_9BACT|nr:hypothetical protein [Hymenobacter telluris]MBO0360217.1 hypothetical protein [Hymenobacter telluris]MBW3376244.1 hypothetical protein [Hymenobacter norwichensis]
MRISINIDPKDGSTCELFYDEENQWIRAIWLGYIEPEQAYEGATGFLEAMQTFHCPYLLNDNSGLRGPWFDSVEWLRTVWAPQATRLGLRYIAHITQPNDLLHEVSALEAESFGGNIQLQVFDDAQAAEEWLREQR